MHQPTVVVFERRPRWAPELQRQFLDEDVHVRACRAVADIPPLLDRSSRNVLLLDLEADPLGCLGFLRQAARCTEAVVVVGSQATRKLEWAAREQGAGEFLPESTSGEALSKLCRIRLGLTRIILRDE